MQRAWMVLLAGCGLEAGCGFQGKLVDDDAGMVPPADSTAIDNSCWTISYTSNATVTVNACPVALGDPLAISGNTSVDTDSLTPNAQGIACAQLAGRSSNLCALAASSITITPTGVLTAHGSKPLALIAHAIDIEGTLDVASHVGGTKAAGAEAGGCELPSTNAANLAMGNGGGQGGTLQANPGGAGGNGANRTSDPGGNSLSSSGITQLRGGCAGGPSGSGTAGGHGGGALWLSVDGIGTLTVGANATISASGASGIGGTASNRTRGGSGGGSGGMIILQAPTLTTASTAKIFANGGPGGGGAADNPGGNGVDPTGPSDSGQPGVAGGDNAGAGGPGFPAQQRDGIGTSNGDGQSGGGGGGGGAGVIWLAAQATTGATTMSPTPIDVTH